MLAIYKREFKSYFYSMTGSIFIAFLTFMTGIYFMAYNLNSGYPYFSYSLEGVMFIFLVAVPILTMRSFSEERRSRTDQLLLTSPVSVGKMVMGKYFAMVTVFLIPCVLFCAYPLIISTQGTAYFKNDYTSILVFFLLGCVYIAIGSFYLRHDGEPDYCGHRNIWCPDGDLSVGWTVKLPSVFRIWRDGRNLDDADPLRFVCLQYDQKRSAECRN